MLQVSHGFYVSQGPLYMCATSSNWRERVDFKKIQIIFLIVIYNIIIQMVTSYTGI